MDNKYEVNRLEYMKMIQDIVKRMANNSFSMKSWCITLTSGIFGINVWIHSNWRYFFLLLFPIFIFWFLDAYYLRQERLFRGLYDRVRKMSEQELNKSQYSMIPPQKDDSDYKESYNYINVLFSITERTLYLSLLFLSGAIIAFLAIKTGTSSNNLIDATQQAADLSSLIQ